ncbi:hypothetical protein JOE11_002268 [Robbsia andropogonis]
MYFNYVAEIMSEIKRLSFLLDNTPPRSRGLHGGRLHISKCG